MKRALLILPTIILFFFLQVFLFPIHFAISSDNVQDIKYGKYERKSISYVDILWEMPKTDKEGNLSITGLTPEIRDYILYKLKEKIESKRFDSNPLPDTLMNQLKLEVASRTNLTPDALAKIFEKTLAPTILEILKMLKEIRARRLIDQTDIQEFIAQRRGEIPLTVEDIMKVLNSAYIYMPYVTGFSHQEKGNYWKCEIKGGILWFALVVPEGKNLKPTVKLVEKRTTQAYFNSSIENKKGDSIFYYWKGDSTDVKLDAYQHSYRCAINQWAKNLQVLSKKIPFFCLQGVIRSVEGRRLDVEGIGKDEGILNDDKYVIAEIEEDKTGRFVMRGYGWGFITAIGDNTNGKNEYSQMYKITGPGAKKLDGMLAVEKPTQRVDWFLRPKYIELAEVDGEPATVWGAEIGFRGNLWKLTGKSQLYSNLSFTLGYVDNGRDYGKIYVDDELRDFFFYYAGVEAGALKRFYYGRFALVAGATGGVHAVFDNSDGDNLDPVIKIAGDIGIDYSLNPCCIVGINAGYNIGFSEGTTNAGYNFKSSGLFYGIHINFSPATLPFDPFMGLF